MTRLTVIPIREQDKERVIALWNACGLVRPHNPPLRDLEFAAGKETSDVLVGWLGDEIVASIMVGHDGHRGWYYYVSVDPARQGQGLGEEIVTAAEDWLRERGVRRINLMVRVTNTKVIGFYDKLGYEASDVVVRQKWLIEDHLA